MRSASTPEYLRTGQDGSVVNLMEYGVPLGRRFRSLKLWFVMRYFGLEGSRDNHSQSHRLGRRTRTADSKRTTDSRSPLRHRSRWSASDTRTVDEQSRELMDRVNAGGVAFLSHTVLNGRFTIRLAIGNVRTTREDIQRVWECIQAEACEL